MGWFSWKRVGSDPYYASYEKSFEKIEKKCDTIEVRRRKRKARLEAYRNKQFYMFGASLAAAVAHIAWMNQQPAGTYGLQEHVTRVAISLLVPCLVYLGYAVLKKFILMWERRDEREIKKLNESKKRMIKDLKDSTRFERTMALIKKYDPEQQPPPQPNPAGVPSGAKGQPGQPGSGVPGARGGPTPTSQLLTRTSAAAAAAAAGAGKALFPVFDTLANSVIGDNPHLVEELRRLQSESNVLRSENDQLKQQLADLRARYGICEDGEQPPAITAGATEAGAAAVAGNGNGKSKGAKSTDSTGSTDLGAEDQRKGKDGQVGATPASKAEAAR